MTLTAALALTIPTPAVASARPAVSQKVLADTCDPVSGTRTYYSGAGQHANEKSR
ncbi:hypothetical protein [Nonomuraea angiospora]|uniref:hypothetical protein n=1 Tax=Nonomuraea angiospora TaxID=46172 RepID=UPI0029A89450|nr:hypothetical protein [Nonomuraea angiospora]MDX3108110.1 hypothetical protein [Nonomuraea angiospora]